MPVQIPNFEFCLAMRWRQQLLSKFDFELKLCSDVLLKKITDRNVFVDE